MNFLELVAAYPLQTFIIAALVYIVAKSTCRGSYWNKMWRDLWYDIKWKFYDFGYWFDEGYEKHVSKIAKHRRISLAIFVGFEALMTTIFSHDILSSQNVKFPLLIIVISVDGLIGAICACTVIISELRARKQRIELEKMK